MAGRTQLLEKLGVTETALRGKVGEVVAARQPRGRVFVDVTVLEGDDAGEGLLVGR